MAEYTQRYDDKWFSSATPVNAVKANGTLTIGGVVIEGETFTIGDTTGEFNAGGGITVGNIEVDISSYTTASQGTLTIDTQPTNANTMTIGTKVYTFKTDGTEAVDGDISIGTSLATAQANIVAAINGTDTLNTANAFVTAGSFSADALVLTAITGGVAGDLISTTETFTAVTNIFDATELGTTTAGVDCTATNAVTAIVAVTDSFDGVTLTDGTGDTVVVTNILVGTEGNDVASTETMANGAFGATKLAGGLYATPVRCATFKIISGVWYIAEKAVDKWDTAGWKSATPTLI